MGSTNFQLWNPGAQNQETDQEYTSDPQRAGGAVTGIFPSILANKLFTQATILSVALAYMIANAGGTITDEDFNDLVTQLTNWLALLESPVFRGTPTTPDPDPNDRSLQIPNTEWVRAITDLLAPKFAPIFSGTSYPVVPRSITGPLGDCSDMIATNAFVCNALAACNCGSGGGNPPPPGGPPLTLIWTGTPLFGSGACNGQACNVTLRASGGTGPYTYSIQSGTLAPGLNFNPNGTGNTAIISGTPTTNESNIALVIRVVDSEDPTVTLDTTYRQTVKTCGSTLGISISGCALFGTPGACQGTPLSCSVVGTGGSGYYAYTIQSGTLPAGVTWNPGDPTQLNNRATISGTPTTLVSNQAVTIRVTDTQTNEHAENTYYATVYHCLQNYEQDRTTRTASGWTNSSNIQYAGTLCPTPLPSPATDDISIGNTGAMMLANNFQFSLPSGAIVSGITVEITREGGGNEYELEDDTVQLLKNGSPVGDNFAQAQPWGTQGAGSGIGIFPYGYGTGGDDPLWGTTWAAGDLNAANFGVNFRAKNVGSAGDQTAKVYCVRVKVFYRA